MVPCGLRSCRVVYVKHGIYCFECLSAADQCSFAGLVAKVALASFYANGILGRIYGPNLSSSLRYTVSLWKVRFFWFHSGTRIGHYCVFDALCVSGTTSRTKRLRKCSNSIIVAVLVSNVDVVSAGVVDGLKRCRFAFGQKCLRLVEYHAGRWLCL